MTTPNELAERIAVLDADGIARPTSLLLFRGAMECIPTILGPRPETEVLMNANGTGRVDEPEPSPYEGLSMAIADEKEGKWPPIPYVSSDLTEQLAAAAANQFPGSVTYVSNNKSYEDEIIEHLALIGRLSERISELEAENTDLRRVSGYWQVKCFEAIELARLGSICPVDLAPFDPKSIAAESGEPAAPFTADELVAALEDSQRLYGSDTPTVTAPAVLSAKMGTVPIGGPVPTGWRIVVSPPVPAAKPPLPAQALGSQTQDIGLVVR